LKYFLQIHPEIYFTVSDQRLYALVTATDDKGLPLGDIFRWDEKLEKWESLKIPYDKISDKASIDEIVVTSQNIFLNGDFSTYQLSKKENAWEIFELPRQQFQKIRGGKIHSLYGLPGRVYTLTSHRQWKELGKKWPNTEAMDLIEVGGGYFCYCGWSFNLFSS